MAISRRQFAQAVLGLGSAWAGAPLLSGCGSGGDDDDGSAPPLTETRTLHFDLKASAPGDVHTLHVGGKRYVLKPHTRGSLAALRRERPRLAAIADAHLTHFAPDVVLSSTRQHRLHVTTASPTRGPGLALVAMHIPRAARLRARGLRAAASSAAPCAPCQVATAAPAAVDCNIHDDGAEGFVSARSTAKALISHSPDILNLDPEAAGLVEAHMEGDAAAVVDNLTISICTQGGGGAWVHDPRYEDGWAVLVPMLGADGTQQVDSHGDLVWDYVFSETTSGLLAGAVAAVVQAVKNDPGLKDKQYFVNYHGDEVDTSALPPATPSPLVGAPAAPAALQASTGDNITYSTLGYHHNVLFYHQSGASTDRSFTLRILNLNFVWYSLYLEYLDADGKPMAAEGSGKLNDVLDAVQLETGTCVFWDMITPPPAIFGIPVPFPYQISLSLPKGASQVRLNLVGPGAFGKLPFTESVIAGTVLTGIFQYVLPGVFLARATGVDTTAELVELLNSDFGVWVKTLQFVGNSYLAALGQDGKNDLGIEGSVTSLMAALVKNMLGVPLNQLAPELWDWCVKTFSREEAEQAVPFAGWILRLVSIGGTIGAMLATTAEIATNPVTISNTVSFTHSVKFVIFPDPDDFTFPLTATHYAVEVTAGTTALQPPTKVQLATGTTPDRLEVVVDNIPSTGQKATASVIFYTSTGYPIAASAETDVNGNVAVDENGHRKTGNVTFMNVAPASGVLEVQVPTVENPAPVDSHTRYTHHHKLVYTSGVYAWSYTATPPALEPPSCGTGAGLCALGNVAVWLPGGMIGYSWLASSPGVASCRGGNAGQLYTFQNVNLRSNPNTGRKTPGCGFPAPTPIAYDAAARTSQQSFHFYLDAVGVSDADPVYYLRRLLLDDSTPVGTGTQESWGRFRIPIDRMAVYTKGSAPRVIGISTRFSKLAMLEIPDAPYVGDDFGNNAKVMSGPGEGNDALMLNPTALAVADNGAVLVLQGGAAKSIKAFDFDGKPWRFFRQGSVSAMPLVPDSTQVTWLDIAIESTGLLYVLSHTGSGLQVSDYRLDVYDTQTGGLVVRNTGIAVGRIAVDKFRGLYTLNYETVKGSPVVEPSVSVWSAIAP